MAKAIQMHQSVIRPSLVAALEAFRAPGQLVSSYYLDLNPKRWGSKEAIRLAAKNALAGQLQRLEQLDVPPAQRHALKHDWESVQEAVRLAAGERSTRSLACFVASAQEFAQVVRLPWPVRNRAFFEEQFVLWPLHLILDQADRYAVCLTDKDEARLFLFYLEQIEEVGHVVDEIPGKVRIPDPMKQRGYMGKHIEHFHRHFARTAEAALRLWRREPFERLIVGGLWEMLPAFEGHLHQYLRDRIVARWDIDVHTPTSQVLERTMQEEQQYLNRQAQEIWKTIQDLRPQRGALGPAEVFAALWELRVQSLLVEPNVGRKGTRCSVCGRLNIDKGPCVECGGSTTEVPDVYDEAVHDAIDQAARVRFWKDPALDAAESLAAFKRF